MTKAEFLSRIDQHIAVANEHFARGNELMAENKDLMAEVKEELAAGREERRDLRIFTRDLMRRSERVTNQLVGEFRRQMAEMRAEIRGQTAELGQLAIQTAHSSQMLADLNEESRAQRGAILRVLDELRREPGE